MAYQNIEIRSHQDDKKHTPFDILTPLFVTPRTFSCARTKMTLFNANSHKSWPKTN